MPIGWDESLTTGVEEIDEQHKELFAHFDRLLKACKEGKGKDELLNMLGFLGEYADYHFRTEEAYMAKHGYEGLAAQRAQHREFREKLRRLERQARIDGAGIDLIAKTNRMILDWIIQHVRNEDRKMVRLLGTAE
ncbi:MAG: hemerythrin family protein [Desulfuromonadales bacterium]|nr:hemerythrin family protein [Desulfuromonadales bacterium]NIR33691.1 hemerythrin family protein [Desulfuromonadales bacterium]NIS44013.1 hemerythrin family protein [Desulfuromonadales bacterium]